MKAVMISDDLFKRIRMSKVTNETVESIVSTYLDGLKVDTDESFEYVYEDYVSDINSVTSGVDKILSVIEMLEQQINDSVKALGIAEFMGYFKIDMVSFPVQNWVKKEFESLSDKLVFLTTKIESLDDTADKFRLKHLLAFAQEQFDKAMKCWDGIMTKKVV